ncbi:hypothetical protein [Chryseobacterium aquaticum]|uniref:hypothetical protein n=1 Tax=Chryseobacterium aquaticum TaxID=452084 RepID=UPI003F6F55AB
METIFIISKEYIEKNDILLKVSKIVNLINASIIENSAEIIITKENNGYFEQIEMNGPNKVYFEETIKNGNFKKDYGCLLTVDFYSEQKMVISFLQLLFKELPNILIYSEIGSNLDFPFVFNESHLEKFSGTDSYALLGNPPQDLSNLA